MKSRTRGSRGVSSRKQTQTPEFETNKGGGGGTLLSRLSELMKKVKEGREKMKETTMDQIRSNKEDRIDRFLREYGERIWIGRLYASDIELRTKKINLKIEKNNSDGQPLALQLNAFQGMNCVVHLDFN